MQDSKYSNDPIKRLIYHISKHMKQICEISLMQVSATLIEIAQELLFSNIQDTKNYQIIKTSILQYYKQKQWKDYTKKKGIFDKFY